VYGERKEGLCWQIWFLASLTDCCMSILLLVTIVAVVVVVDARDTASNRCLGRLDLLNTNTKYRHLQHSTSPPILEMSVFDILRRYALVKSPSTQIPASVLLIDSPQCITIFDAYPKAKYHFLVLPRHPFLSGIEGEGAKSLCSVDNLDDLESVMTRTSMEARREIVGAMSSMAKEVVEMIRDEMMKTEGFTWGVDVGFHAEPSMRSALCLDCEENVADQIDISTCM
jgi:hypothetical protein